MAKIAAMPYIAAHAKALILLNNFKMQASTPSAFPQFTKNDIINSLMLRITGPSKINQFEASLCGPAAFYYTLTINRPDLFAKAVIDLYTTGKAKLGDLNIQPGASMKAYGSNPQDLKGINLPGYMNETDWMILASLRDSSNSVFNYDAMSDQVGGITFPGTITNWYEMVGFSAQDNTNLLSPKGIDNLLQAYQARKNGESVNLFVNMSIWDAEDYKVGLRAFTPNHWVVLNSDILIDGLLLNGGLAASLEKERASSQIEDSADFDYTGKEFLHTVKFDIYSWGGTKWKLGGNSNVTGTIDLDTFLNNYFGYVSIAF